MTGGPMPLFKRQANPSNSLTSPKQAFEYANVLWNGKGEGHAVPQ